MLRDNKLCTEVYIDGELVYTSNSINGQLHEILDDIREGSDRLQKLHEQYAEESQRLINEIMWSVHTRVDRILAALKKNKEENNVI